MSFIRANLLIILISCLILMLFVNVVGVFVRFSVGRLSGKTPNYKMKLRYRIMKIFGSISLLIYIGNSVVLSYPNPYAALINIECQKVKSQANLKVIIDTSAEGFSNSIKYGEWKRNVFSVKYPNKSNTFIFGKSPVFSLNSHYDSLLIYTRPAEGRIIKKIKSGFICGELCGVGYEHYYVDLKFMMLYLFTGENWIF